MSDTINRLRDLADKSKDTAQACEAAAQILMSYDREDEFYAGVERNKATKLLDLPYEPRHVIKTTLYQWALGIAKEYDC